ncbi:hypothetical protein V3C99_019205 [Haemonchus contortus]|uniref:Craniofacial development protein 2-like n=1 Tax=Haemonchus contortus TaxID=6289 RepID=A0A7I4Z055_HAECO
MIHSLVLLKVHIVLKTGDQDQDHTFFKVIVGDFNAKLGPRRTAEKLHIGADGMGWIKQGERLSEFVMTTYAIHGNSRSQSPISCDGQGTGPDGQLDNETDPIIFNWRFCLTYVAVVPKFFTGSDHRLPCAIFCFSIRGERAMKFRKRNPKTCINWDHIASHE